MIGAFVTAMVIVGVRRVLRRRGSDGTLASHRVATEISLIVVGFTLMVLGLVVGQHVLAVKEPPHGEQFASGVGIVPSVRARPNRGFMASLGAQFRSCDKPVDVTIVLAGSAEYFEDQRSALRKMTAVTIGVPGKRLKDVRLGYGRTYSDLFTPLKTVPARDAKIKFTATPPRERRAVTSISAKMRDWAREMVPIVVRFKADWLAPRGLGTCYLRLPPLVGNSSIIGGEDARGRSTATLDEFATKYPQIAASTSDDEYTITVPYDTSLTIRRGVSVIDAGGNEILDSRPETQIVTGSLPGIACSAHSPRTGFGGDKRAELIFSGLEGVAIRDRSFTSLSHEFDCSSVSTMAEAGAASRRDLVLLIIGAVFSLGAALVLEVGLDIQRRRFQAAAHP